jgi:hypothetical protein
MRFRVSGREAKSTLRGSAVVLGTPALAAAKSRELAALFGDTHRFIPNAGRAIPAGAPEANVRAVVRAARSW